MKALRTSFMILVLLGGVGAATAGLAKSGAADRAETAADTFQRGDYKSALRQYLKLAKGGDTFAQYRVSYMELMGLGTQPDVVEAMAWAVLAAESGHEDLLRFQDAVARVVPGKQRKKAQAKADYYLRRWGREDRSGGRTLARVSEGSCTGSRLAANCGQGGSAGSVWIAWGDDRSADPAQSGLLEELNRSIQENASEIRDHAAGS